MGHRERRVREIGRVTGEIGIEAARAMIETGGGERERRREIERKRWRDR